VAQPISLKSLITKCNYNIIPWLHVIQNYLEIISKVFQRFISHETTSETEIKSFQPPKEFQDHFKDKLISAITNTLENIRKLQ